MHQLMSITANLPHSVVTDEKRLQSPKERKTVQFPNLIIGQVNCIELVLNKIGSRRLHHIRSAHNLWST